MKWCYLQWQTSYRVNPEIFGRWNVRIELHMQWKSHEDHFLVTEYFFDKANAIFTKVYQIIRKSPDQCLQNITTQSTLQELGYLKGWNVWKTLLAICANTYIYTRKISRKKYMNEYNYDYIYIECILIPYMEASVPVSLKKHNFLISAITIRWCIIMEIHKLGRRNVYIETTRYALLEISNSEFIEITFKILGFKQYPAPLEDFRSNLLTPDTYPLFQYLRYYNVMNAKVRPVEPFCGPFY